LARIRLEQVSKKYGAKYGVRSLSFEVSDGEFFCLLGPPGAGKTTTLRIIAGLEKPDEGEIYIDGEIVNPIGPRDRDVAMIFQNLALYPNRTVFENFAFPLRIRKMADEEITRKVTEVADILKVSHLLERSVINLSGGEKQRVAIGRALVRKPKVFLLDEPLTNLDALLRLNMRIEMKKLQQEIGRTIIYSTPDPLEAMTMADRIAVMSGGTIIQIDTPEHLYQNPSNKIVAGILGSPPMNFLPASVVHADGEVWLDVQGVKINVASLRNSETLKAQKQITVGIRPEDIIIEPIEEATEGRGDYAEVLIEENLGNELIIYLSIGDTTVKVLAPVDTKVSIGNKVKPSFKPEKMFFFSDSGERIR